MADPLVPPTIVPPTAPAASGAPTSDAPDAATTAAQSIDASNAPAIDPTAGFNAAADDAEQAISSRLQKQSDTTEANESVLSKGLDMVGSAGVGLVKAFVNTANAIPGQSDSRAGIMQTPILSSIYAAGAELDRRSMANSITDNTSSFVVGMLGVGKAFEAVKLGEGLAALGTAGKVGGELAKGAAASSLVFAPHQARLSDLIQSNPMLKNPINAFLANNDDDSEAMGRLKNALEGAGMDVALAGTFSLALRAYRAAAHVAAGTGTKATLDAATNDLTQAVQGRAAGTGWGGDDQVSPTDPLAQPAAADTDLPPTRINPETGKPITRVVVHGANPIEPPDVAGGGTGDGGTAGAPSAGEPSVSPEAPAAEAAPPAPITDTIIGQARATGQLKGRVSQATIKQALSGVPDVADAPRINTNGVGFTVIPDETMAALGKPFGIDSSNWAAAAHNGQILLTQGVLDKAPAEQARIIAHELGHVLQPKFMEASGVKSLPRNELTAASQAFRPEHYAAAMAKAGTAAGKQAAQYLSKSEELFADSFGLWKTDPAKMAQVAPKTKALFDEHFQPWIDTDLTTLAPNTMAAKKLGMVGKPIAIGPKMGRAVPDQVAAKPVFTPRMEMQPTDTEQLMKSSAQDQAAIKKFGSQEAATAAGYKFANSTLPYQKLLADGGYQVFHDRLASDFKATLDQMKGGDVLHDARVQQLVDERVKLFNEDPSDILGELQAAGHNANAMVANTEAALAIANKAGVDLKNLADAIHMGNYSEFGGDEAAAKAALPGRMALYVEAMGNAQSMRAAAGRVLRRQRGDFAITPETLANIKSMDPDHVASIISQAAGNPRMTAKMASNTWWHNAMRAAGTYLANNLLWNWKTHVAIDISHAFMLSTTPAMRAVGSFALGSAGKDIRTVASREYRYMISNMADAAKVAGDAYLRGDSVLSPHNAEAWQNLQASMGATPIKPAGAAQTLAASMGMRPVQNFGDVISNGIHGLGFMLSQPMRVHGLENEIIQQISYRASVMARASLDADHLGLQGSDYSDFLQKALDNSMDADGKALDKDAAYDAQVRTFSQPLLKGTAGQLTTEYAAKLGPWTRFILPFQRTPINLFRYSVKMSPIINLAQKEYRQMISGQLGPQRQADAWGQMALGTGILSTATLLAHNGVLTGGAPPNPSDAKALEDTGWKPYSYVVTHPDGSHTFVPYDRFDPVGMLLGMVADTGQIMHSNQVGGDKLDQVVLPTVIALMHNLTDRSYLQNLTEALQGITSPQEALPKFAGNLASGLTPASSLLGEVNTDPYMRDAKGILDTVMAKLPGFSTSLPPVRDAFGYPMLRSNVMAYGDKPGDIVDAEQERMETDFGFGVIPPTAQPWGGIDLRQFKMADGQTAFDRWQQLSIQPPGARMSMKDALAKEITSPGYKTLPDGDGSLRGTKLSALQAIVGKYRDAAKMALLKESPTLAVQIGARQQAVREAHRDLVSGDQTAADKASAVVSSQLQGINKAFGLSQ